METLQSQHLAALIAAWEPPTRPHCSNCAHAHVGGFPADPMVDCTEGHNDRPYRMALGAMLRLKYPSGFRVDGKCPDFESMSDGEG